jgi:hypothetical protein
MAELKLLHGQIALIDDEDLPKVQGYSWTVNSHGYVVAVVGPKDKRQVIKLHRLILNTPEGLDTDHRDRDKLNNRKSNLRKATRRQNTGNRVVPKDGCTSRYKGVYWHSLGKGHWRARFGYRDEGKIKHKHLGLFDDEVVAAKAYDAAAIEHFGKDFALLNFP